MSNESDWLEKLLEKYKRGLMCILKNGKLCSSDQHLSLTEAKAQISKHEKEAVLRARIEEIENFQWNDAHLHVNTRLAELQANLKKLEEKS